MFNLVCINKSGDFIPPVFADTIFSARRLFEQFGIKVAVNVNKVSPLVPNIIWGAGSHFSFPLQELDGIFSKGRFIIFNMEQLGSTSILVTDEYISFLKRHHVMDYNTLNLEVIGPSEELLRLEFPLMPASEFCGDFGQRKNLHVDFDIAFYGALSERRVRVIQALERLGLSVVCINNAYGAALGEALTSARLVLNLHAYDSGIFESARCLRPVAMGIPIVSESSFLPKSVDWTESGIIFCSTEDIARNCIHLLRESETYLFNVRKSLSFVNSHHIRYKFQDFFSDLLLRLNL